MKRKLDFDILESLRGLAALYVCIGHCRGVLWIGGERFQQIHPRSTWSMWDYVTIGLNMLTRLSTEFVIIFFVLSGFSIAHSLRKNREPLGFYKRRFIRLYPPYVTAILWAMLVAYVLRIAYPHFFDGTYDTNTFNRLKVSNGLFDPITFAKNLIYIPQLGGLINPFWSLMYEVIFYLIAPFVLARRNLYYIGSIVAYIAVVIGYRYMHLTHTLISNFLYFNIFFFVGVALYHHFEAILSYGKILLTRFSLILIPLIFFTMIGVSLVKWDTFNDLLAATLSCLMIIYLLANNKRIRPLIAIGRFSYTLYITHFPTIFVYLGFYYYFTKAKPPYITNNLVFLPCVLLCLSVAWLQYNLVERQTKRILDRLRTKNTADPESVPLSRS